MVQHSYLLSPVTQTNLADGTQLNNASQRKMSKDRPFNRLIDRWMKYIFPRNFYKIVYKTGKKEELYGYTRSRGPNCAGLHHLTFGETWPCHFHMNTINRSLIEIISNISFPEIATSPSLHQHPPDGPTLVLTLPCNPNKSS